MADERQFDAIRADLHSMNKFCVGGLMAALFVGHPVIEQTKRLDLAIQAHRRKR